MQPLSLPLGTLRGGGSSTRRVAGTTRARQRGVSLLELTLLVVILGALAAAALPGLATGDPHRLALAADEATAALRFARGEALRTGQPHGVRLKSGPASLEVFRLDVSGPSPVEVYDVHHPLTRHLYAQPLAGPPFPSGTRMTADFRYAAAAAATAAVGFDRRGEPVSPVDLKPLYQPGTLAVTLNGVPRTVSLAPVTGRVTVQ